MKAILILFIGLLVYCDFPSDEGFVDYGADYDSSVLQNVPADPEPNYFSDETAPARSLASTEPASSDPNANGGTVEPAMDTESTKAVEPASVAKTEEQEDADFYEQCTSKGFAPEQCCRTCVDSYLTSWADDNCSGTDECARQESQTAEAAARDGAKESATQGVSSGQ